MKGDHLSAQMQVFVAEYLVDKHATNAAIRAGYSKHTAKQRGSVLLKHPKVAAAIAERLEKQLASIDLTSARVLEEIKRLALVDFRDFFDAKGNLKPINQLTAEQGSCLSSVEVVVKNLVAGDGQVDMVHKVKAWDKVRALELLAKYFKLLVDRVEVTADDELVRLLQSARKRADRVR